MKTLGLTLDGVFENAPIGMALVSLDGSWLRVNPAVCGLLGYLQEELLEKTFLDVTHPEDLDEDLELVQECVRGERDRYQMEKRYLTKTGEVVFASLHVSIVRTSKREPDFFISQIVDITDLKEKNRDLERFASAAAHQLRSPPRSILGMVEAVLEDDPNLSEESIEYLQDIRMDALSMTDVVDGLSRFSKIRMMEKADLQNVDVTALVQKVRDRVIHLCPAWYSKSCPGHHCTKKKLIPGCPVILIEDLPEASSDPLLLSQVFENLIGNGLKFNSSPEKVVRIRGEEEPNWSTYYVEDNGVGIPEGCEGKLFKVFQRVHVNYPGTGVGLAMAKAIIQKLGGRIWIDKSDKSGTVFAFTLPRENEHAGPEETEKG